MPSARYKIVDEHNNPLDPSKSFEPWKPIPSEVSHVKVIPDADEGYILEITIMVYNPGGRTYSNEQRRQAKKRA